MLNSDREEVQPAPPNAANGSPPHPPVSVVEDGVPPEHHDLYLVEQNGVIVATSPVCRLLLSAASLEPPTGRRLDQVIDLQVDPSLNGRSLSWQGRLGDALGEVTVDGWVRNIDWEGNRARRYDFHTAALPLALAGLRERQEVLELMIRASKAGQWWVNLDPERAGELPESFQISDAVKALLGYGPDELPNSMDAWFDRVLPEDLERVKPVFEEYLDGRRVDHDIEYRFRRRDGSIAWLRSCGRMLFDEQGRPERLLGIEWDITGRRCQEEEARRSQQRFASLFRLVPTPASLIRVSDKKYAEINDAHVSSLKYSREEALGKTVDELGLWPSSTERRRFLDLLEKDGSVRELEAHLVARDGERQVAILSAEMVEVDGELCILTAGRDATAERRAKERLVDLAHRDALTGLANRTLGMQRLEEALEHGRRDGSATALMFIDLDRMKSVNDSLGHGAGDALLIAAGQRLAADLRSTDTLARFGGDEMVAVVRVEDEEAARRLAGRLLDNLSAPLEIEGVCLHPTASIGVAVTRGELEATDLLHNADSAMYWVKQRSGNGVRLFDADEIGASPEQSVRRELHLSLDREQFRLLYQPIVRLDDLSVWGAEALLRWHHPERGVVPPAELIPEAERSGLIGRIGGWVLRQACGQLARWQADGTVADDFVLSANVAAAQLQSPDFARNLEEILKATGVAPASLLLEITERLAVVAMEQAEAVEALGVRLAIDDYGGGYGTLSHLRRLDVEVIKVDRSLTADMAGTPRAARLVDSVLKLGDRLDRTVVVEGIETAEQLRLLREMGAELGQGFLFAQALSSDQLAEVARKPRLVATRTSHSPARERAERRKAAPTSPELTELLERRAS